MSAALVALAEAVTALFLFALMAAGGMSRTSEYDDGGRGLGVG